MTGHFKTQLQNDQKTESKYVILGQETGFFLPCGRIICSFMLEINATTNKTLTDDDWVVKVSGEYSDLIKRFWGIKI